MVVKRSPSSVREPWHAGIVNALDDFLGQRPPDRGLEVLGQTVRFYPRHWAARVPQCWPQELTGTVDARGGRGIDRAEVFTYAVDGSQQDQGVAGADVYFAACAWGSGSKARTVARRLRPLIEDAHEGCSHPMYVRLGEAIWSALTLQREAGPVAAYALLSGPGRIPGLGPAFFTKVLYFGHGADLGPGGPLILDRYVAAALNDLYGWGWPLAGWSSKQYADYLTRSAQLADKWSSLTGSDVTTDVVEYSLFKWGRHLAASSKTKLQLPLHRAATSSPNRSTSSEALRSDDQTTQLGVEVKQELWRALPRYRGRGRCSRR